MTNHFHGRFIYDNALNPNSANNKTNQHMKKIYIISLAVLASVSAVSASPRFQTKRLKAASISESAKATAALWRPESLTDYGFNLKTGQWNEIGTTSYVYDARGNVAEMTSIDKSDADNQVTYVTRRTYNENDLVLTEDKFVYDGNHLLAIGDTYYEYDPILKDYFTSRMGHDLINQEWIESYRCEINKITRDADGNIIKILKSIPFRGVLTGVYRSEWTYGADKKPSEFRYYANYGDDVAPDWLLYANVSYKNMKWAETNGQITVSNPVELVEGANRLVSAEVYYKEVLDGHILVDYDGKGGYSLKETFADSSEVGRLTTKAFTDANGSFVMTVKEYFDEMENVFVAPTYETVMTVVYNDHGDPVLQEITESENNSIPELIQGEKLQYDYDANGNPTQIVTMSYDYDSKAYFEDLKTVFGNYIDASSSIDEVVVDSSDAHAVYFDLSGRQVQSPTVPGLYIRRQGSTTSKMVVR